MAIFRIGRRKQPAFLAFALSLASAQPGYAQDQDGMVIHRSRDTGLATFVSSADEGPILIRVGGAAAPAPVSVDVFLAQVGRLFGISDNARQLAPAETRRDQLGHTHIKFTQHHLGVPVFGAQVRVHQDGDGHVYAANGHFFPIPEKMIERPGITAQQAVEAASADFESEKPLVLRSELTIVDPGWYGDPPVGPTLAYYIELHDPASGVAEAFFINALSAKELDRWSLVETARNRKIYDGRESGDLPGLLARGEGTPPVVSPADVNRAFDYYGDTYDYFARGFGRDSLDDAGIAIVATVNSIAPGCPNAFWSSGLRQMAFCAGTVTDDITAHELTHGITYFTAQLIYQNQSGQLNESFSDVFGELVDLFNGDVAFPLGPPGPRWPTHLTGPGADQLNSLRTECSPRVEYHDGVRWLMGEDAFAFGGAIRDMWDPTCRFDPDRAWSPLQTCGPGDNGGVHSGSGIPNHAFAMLVDGKDFNGYSVRGIGPIKAGAVWYRALTTYLSPISDFEDSYVAFTQSARDLIGTFPLDPRTGFPSTHIFTREDVVQVDLALKAVEMNGPGRCGWKIPILNDAPAPACGDELQIYENDFEHDAAGWTASNSGALTPYDWELTELLPGGRSGTAWYCDNPNIGNCRESDESGWHILTSPPIEMPLTFYSPLLRFTHYIDVETGWDGGTVAIRVNGGRWLPIASKSFLFNPYNTALQGRPRNTNPFAGREAWSGIAGQWGTSIVDLREFAGPGDTIEIRFEFGKDGCTGRIGWLVDDFAVYGCRDCNWNGHLDNLDFVYTNTSGRLMRIGAASPQRYSLSAPLPAASDVTLRVYAIADLTGLDQDESLFVTLNGELLGEIFAHGGRECPSTPDLAELVIPRNQFNKAVLSEVVEFEVTANQGVDSNLCSGRNWVRFDLEYRTTTADVDDNQIPDECQGCQVASPPQPVSDLKQMNRYLAFVPAANTRYVAHRIRRSGPQTSKASPSAIQWVGRPAPALSDGEAPHYYATTRCESYFSSEWVQGGQIFVFGDFIIPGATYAIDSIEAGCIEPHYLDDSAQPRSQDRVLTPHYSKALTLRTAPLWGDITGSDDGSPDGNVDFRDVSAVIDRFVAAAHAVNLHEADLAPDIPDHTVNFTDVSLAVDAYRGAGYPFATQSRCGQ